jgi:hypothetical protein
MKNILSNRWAQGLVIVGIVLAVYIALLQVKIPYSFSVFFTQYSLGFFLIVWISFSFAFRLRSWPGWLLGFSLTAILLLLPLSYKWTSGFTDNRVIAGLIPYKDQYYYYNGAREVLNGNLIPKDYLQAVWRPLFPALFSNFLVVTGQNLKWSLATLTFLSAIAIYISGRGVRSFSGRWGAGLFMSTLLIYSIYYVGMPASELAATALACLAFSMFISSAQRHEKWLLFVGIGLLTLSMCMRASAFLIFPLLAIWAGWVFRGFKRYSPAMLAVSALVFVFAFVLFSPLSQKLLVEPGSTAQGNFAYTMYGQAMGGIGYKSAVENIGTDTSLVMKKTLELIVYHPRGIIVGSLKAYRDFFSPLYQIIIPFDPWREKDGVSFLPWSMLIFLYIWGLIQLVRSWRKPISSLLIATTAGIIVSVPFLPPVDGGARFYTNVAPFLLAIPAFGLGHLISRWVHESEESDHFTNRSLIWITCSILFLIIITPILFKLAHSMPATSSPVCPQGQVPFQTQIGRDSYVDIYPININSSGIVPNISLAEFKSNGFEPWDDFYQLLVSSFEGSTSPTRIFSSKNFLDGHLSFFLGDANLFRDIDPNSIIDGCAETNHSTYQSIYMIRSVNVLGN